MTLGSTDRLQKQGRRWRARPRILVLGLGNTLFSDDGVGVEIATRLREKPRVGVFVTEVGTSILAAIPFLEWADRVLIIDSMKGGKAPGSIYYGAYDDVRPSFEDRSIHERSISLALELSNRNLKAPEIHALGIEPARLDLGCSLSETLTSRMPLYLEYAEKLIEAFRAEPRELPQSKPKLVRALASAAELG
jgi:hydrogenase maturation protease